MLLLEMLIIASFSRFTEISLTGSIEKMVALVAGELPYSNTSCFPAGSRRLQRVKVMGGARKRSAWTQ